MEELQPEELEELVQELEGESDDEETLSQHVDELLRDLQPACGFMVRLRAARQLGEVSDSSRQIVHALMTVAETDASDEVKTVAAESLRARVHQKYLQEYLDQKRAAETTRQQRPITDRQVPQIEERPGRRMAEQQSRIPVQCLKAGSIAGLLVGVALGLVYAELALSWGEGLGCGVPFLVALTVGAVVGAPVGAVAGAEERGPQDRVPSIAAGAISAALVASLSWVPITVFRIVQLGGP